MSKEKAILSIESNGQGIKFQSGEERQKEAKLFCLGENQNEFYLATKRQFNKYIFKLVGLPEGIAQKLKGIARKLD